MSRPDPFEEYRQRYGANPAASDPFEAYRQRYGTAEPEGKGGGGLLGGLRTVAQGVTLGFGDEIEGLARGAAALVPGGDTPGGAMRREMEDARQSVAGFKEAHPVGS